MLKSNARFGASTANTRHSKFRFSLIVLPLVFTYLMGETSWRKKSLLKPKKSVQQKYNFWVNWFILVGSLQVFTMKQIHESILGWNLNVLKWLNRNDDDIKEWWQSSASVSWPYFTSNSCIYRVGATTSIYNWQCWKIWQFLEHFAIRITSHITPTIFWFSMLWYFPF